MAPARSFPGRGLVRAFFGANPADPFGWEDMAQDTLITGQFAQQWKLRMMEQGAALMGIADSGLRKSLAYDKTFNCTDVTLGDSVIFYKATNKESLPYWGATAKFQPQTFRVARFCVWGKVEAKRRRRC